MVEIKMSNETARLVLQLVLKERNSLRGSSTYGGHYNPTPVTELSLDRLADVAADIHAALAASEETLNRAVGAANVS